MTINITINERPLTAARGLSILQAARQNDIYIPTLCDYPGLPPHGSCRMCIVEIKGKHHTPTACTTPIEEGMVILTDSPKVQSLRAELLKMLLADHPAGCLFCEEKSHCSECMVTVRKAGVTTGCRSCAMDSQCELQEMVAKSGITQLDYPVRYRMLPVEKRDPFFDRDYNLCILCGRCIRTCAELHFDNILVFTERGAEALVGTAFNRSHLQAGCSFCGTCIEVCPTGALSEKTRKWDGRPENETTTTCPLCSIGCQIKLLSKRNTVIGSLPDHQAGPTDGDALCVKGRFGITELVNHPTRLKRPQTIAGHNKLGIPWEEAAHLAAEKLLACPPGQFEMVVSPNLTNEDLYLAGKFTHQVMGSGRIQAPALAVYGGGLEAVLNLLRQAQPLSVLAESQTILCLGLDAQYSQSVVEVKLKQAKTRGARILTLHTREHNLAHYADAWLQPQPGRETELIEALVEQIRQPAVAVSNQTENGDQGRIEQTAQILRETADLAIIVGPSFLVHPDNQRLLPSVDRLVSQSGARVIVLPEQGNLVGTVLLGNLPGNSSPHPEDELHPQDVKVLYVMGEDIPASIPGEPFILYQNTYPPSQGRTADLMLPAAAFSEVEGTTINHSGSVLPLQPAVPPPGEALPAWQSLCRIAQKMGAQGFDYTCAAEIQAEIAGWIENFQPGGAIDASGLSQAAGSGALVEALAQQPDAARGAGGQQAQQDHMQTYLGFPLTRWIAGLKPLYPDPVGSRQVYVQNS